MIRLGSALCCVSFPRTHRSCTQHVLTEGHKDKRQDLKCQTSGPPRQYLASKDSSRRCYLSRVYEHGHLPGPLPHSGLQPCPVVLVSICGPVTTNSSNPFLTRQLLSASPAPCGAREVGPCPLLVRGY